MHLLTEKGYTVTAGVINLLDSDHEVAQLLQIPVTTEAPFSPITETAFQAQLDQIRHADAVVLCNIPVGFGNLKNVEAAEVALSRLGKGVILVESDPIAKRDFTNGEATKRVDALKRNGAIVVSSPEAVHEVLATI